MYTEELKSRGLETFTVEYTTDGELWEQIRVVAKDNYDALSEARLILTDLYEVTPQQLKLLQEG